jgi:hypothetical protein
MIRVANKHAGRRGEHKERTQRECVSRSGSRRAAAEGSIGWAEQQEHMGRLPRGGGESYAEEIVTSG